MLVSCFEISKDLIRHQITLFMLCLTSQKPCVRLMEGVHYLTNYSPITPAPSVVCMVLALTSSAISKPIRHKITPTNVPTLMVEEAKIFEVIFSGSIVQACYVALFPIQYQAQDSFRSELQSLTAADY